MGQPASSLRGLGSSGDETASPAESPAVEDEGAAGALAAQRAATGEDLLGAQDEALEAPPPPPRFSNTVWLASCRPAGRLNRFAKPLMYQPDTRLFCPNGPSCRQRREDPAHARLCIHTQAGMDGGAGAVTELVNPPALGAVDEEDEGDVEEDGDDGDETVDEDEGADEDDRDAGASPLWIPHVRYAFDVRKAALADPNAEVLAGLPHNRTVVIYVHGFRADDPDTHSFRTIGCLLHLQLRLREGQAALQQRRDDATHAGSSEMRESAAAAVADAVGAAAARQRHDDWDGWAATQHPVIAGGLITEQGRRVRLSSHESEDIVLSAPNSPAPRSGEESPDTQNRDGATAETAEHQRQAIMQRRAEAATARLRGQGSAAGGGNSGSQDDPAAEEEDVDSPIIMGFVWPCHSTTTAYSKARDKAERAGKVLRPILETLAARGNTTLIVAHSMGSRVALTALREEPTVAPDIMFGNPINSPSPRDREPEPEPEPEVPALAPPPLPRPQRREPAAGEPQAEEETATNAAPSVESGTVLWREGHGIVDTSDANAEASTSGSDAGTSSFVLPPVEGVAEQQDRDGDEDGDGDGDGEVTEAPLVLETADGGANSGGSEAAAAASPGEWTYDGTEQTPRSDPSSSPADDDGGRNDDAPAPAAESAGGTADDAPESLSPLAAHLFLLAGAVSADALHRGRGEFSLERLLTENVTVAYSSNDSVLRDAFWLGEAMPALRTGGGSAMKINPRRPSSLRGGAAGALAHAKMTRDATKTAATAIGFQGPTEGTLRAAGSTRALLELGDEEKCATLRTVDVTGSVRSHRVNQWLGSAEVSLRVAAAVQAAAVERAAAAAAGRGDGGAAAGMAVDRRRFIDEPPTQEELERARLSATSSICTPTKADRELDESQEPDGDDDDGGGGEGGEATRGAI